MHRSRAARGCTPSQAPKNAGSCSRCLSHPPGPDPAASLFDGYARCALDPIHSSHPTLTSHIAHAAPVHRSVRAPRALHRPETLPRHGCSRPLATHACAGQRHCNLDGQSCGARAGDASTFWVPFLAVRDERAVSRGATPIHACGQCRRWHRRVATALCYLLADPPTQYFLESSRSKLLESYRVR